MSTIIVTGRKGCDTDALKQRIIDAGYDPHQYSALRRFFRISNETKDGFTLKDDPDVLRVADADKIVAHAVADYPISYTSGQFRPGGWHLPGVCRRSLPWAGQPYVPMPYDTFFRSNRSGAGVNVYIMDSGVILGHNEFGDRGGGLPLDTYSGYSDPSATNYHGTSVASLAAGAQVGVAKEANVWDIKITSGDSSGASFSAFVNGFNDALDHYQNHATGPGVLNNSFGGYLGSWLDKDESYSYQGAIEDLIDAGVVCVFPAGNNKRSLETYTFYPAQEDPDAIVVGGSAVTDKPYSRPNDGTNYSSTEVDLVAPSEDIEVADHLDNSGFRFGSGTSFGTPIVAGVVACMLEGYQKLSSRAHVVAVKNQLLANATTGRLTQAFGLTLPDRLVYLDPDVSVEVIPGLEDLAPS